jgi:Holliday junction resolvasome RuvABC ATP-dependent DNA helicase subunit
VGGNLHTAWIATSVLFVAEHSAAQKGLQVLMDRSLAEWEGLARPLTLISAPPGFGKTTLVTMWLEQQTQPAAWLSLDERDNDLARFLAYLVAALETVQVDVICRISPILELS